MNYMNYMLLAVVLLSGCDIAENAPTNYGVIRHHCSSTGTVGSVECTLLIADEWSLGGFDGNLTEDVVIEVLEALEDTEQVQE